ncbi:MAG: cysteine--tRNA ligase, partial [Archaeoglobales archaeon]
RYLGVPFDIHGGGKDLIFPHHENERAQSYALYGVEPVRYWIHNDFVTIRGEKMSKSLGNIVRIKDVLKKKSGEVLRYFLLSAHYRSPLDYSDGAIERAEKAYIALRNTLELIDMEIAALKTFGAKDVEKSGELNDATLRLLNNFKEAMEDDFNTPKAIAALHDFSTSANKLVNEGNVSLDELEVAFKKFSELCGILGIFADYRRIPPLSPEQAELVKERELARKERDFEKADKIREEFRSKGYALIDTPRGTRWKLI